MTVRIDIGICTFRRPQVTETLASLAEMIHPEGVQLRVIVADNDVEPTARETVAAVSLPFELIYLHAPSRNISIARNAILAKADADYLAFIDDDETVDPHWLVELYAKARAKQADVVFGPLIARYPPETPAWMVEGDYHSVTQPKDVSEVRTGATCNALINLKSKACEGLVFDTTLGQSGGEDTVFFYNVAERGGRMFFAHKAIVYEIAASKRLSLDWLIERKYRSGQSHAVAMLRGSPGAATRVTLSAKAAMKAAFCTLGTGANLFRPARRNYWRIRGALHRGVISKCFGSREKALYGTTP